MSLSVIERRKYIEETGEWWIVPWWREYGNSPQIEAGFGELRRVFDQDWMLERVNKKVHLTDSMASRFFGGGPYYFNVLNVMGMNLLIAKRNTNCRLKLRSLERRLKDDKEFEGAEFELAWMAKFIRCDFGIEPDYPSGNGNHNCEFKITKNGEIFFVEVKRPADFHFRSQIVINKCSQELQKVISGSASQGLEGIPLCSETEMDKMFAIIEDAANTQIPPEGPGIIIIRSPLDFNVTRFTDLAKERLWSAQDFRHISVIIIDQVDSDHNAICSKLSRIANPAIDISSSLVLRELLE